MKHVLSNVWWCGAIDWDRRAFDALVPLPDGTSYNSYLVRGAERTVLLDGVDETQRHVLFEHLRDVAKIDFIVAQHAEQDHSGTLPDLMRRYPDAILLSSPLGVKMLQDLLDLPPERMRAVKDGETLDLGGGQTLRFVMTPWVHWPETMCSFLEPERVLFSCDFYGSHLATSELYAKEGVRVYRAAKLYYAQIMMPYARQITRNLDKAAALQPLMIAPSHGPLYDKPEIVMDAWKKWNDGPPKNLALVAYVSMHGSTRRMTERLVAALQQRHVGVRQFELTSTDAGELAMTLVDAATVILGTPAMLNGPHPAVSSAALLINALKPKARWVALYGSYGWSEKALDSLPALLGNLSVEWLPPVMAKGYAREESLRALDSLAEQVAAHHLTVSH
jgi:flavorubredoxin